MLAGLDEDDAATHAGCLDRRADAARSAAVDDDIVFPVCSPRQQSERVPDTQPGQDNEQGTHGLLQERSLAVPSRKRPTLAELRVNVPVGLRAIGRAQGLLQPSLVADGKVPAWGNGVLFVGERGLLLADYGKHLLLPEAEFAGYKRPEPTIASALLHGSSPIGRDRMTRQAATGRTRSSD